MTRVLVVFESMFGNTKEIADAVADGLSSGYPVDVVDVASAPTRLPDDVALVVAGGPTHAFGMSRRGTRATALQQRGSTVTSTDTGLREWLAAVSRPERPVAAVTFDTRVSRPRVPGSAAHKAERRLRRLGFHLLAPSMTFWVGGTPGPLDEGERMRAREWGATLARSLTRAAAHSA